MTIGNLLKMFEIFGENGLKFIEKCKIIKGWRIISLDYGKVRELPSRIDPKMKETFKNFKKIFSNFNQNLYGKLTSFTFLTKYFLDFWLLSSLDLWKIIPDFYYIFPILPAFPLSRRYCIQLSISFQIISLGFEF